MTRIGRVPIDESDDPEVRAIADELIGYKGVVPDHYRLEGHLPDLLKHVWYAQEAVNSAGPISLELLRKVGLVVSMANGCTYCSGAYCSLLSSELVGDDAVRQFQEAVVEDDLSDLEAAVIDCARKVNDDPHGITDADVERLKAEHGLSDAGLLQVVYQVNLVSGYNRVTTVFDAAYDHAFPEADADRRL